MNRKFIASGFRQDMELLFSKFIDSSEQKTNQSTTESNPSEAVISLRFKRFSEIWVELNFSYIFKGRVNENELKELIDETYLEVLPHLCSDKPFERRVASIYLLYSLFVKQPKEQTYRQHIRLNYSYLEQIRDLIDKAKRLEQFDVCFCWYKLLSLGAIDFVHVSRLMGPQYIRNSRVTSETETYTDFLIDQFKSSILQPVDELSLIHEQYRNIKDALVDEKIDGMETVTQVDDNIFELMKAKMDNLHTEFANQAILKKGVESETFVMSEELPKEEDIGSRRRRLKERSMAKNATDITPNTVTESIDSKLISVKHKLKRGRPKKSRLM